MQMWEVKNETARTKWDSRNHVLVSRQLAEISEKRPPRNSIKYRTESW